MRVVCIALVENEMQKSNLCQCIKILGGEPSASGNTVCTECNGSISAISKFIELFEQYPIHGIIITSRK